MSAFETWFIQQHRTMPANPALRAECQRKLLAARVEVERLEAMLQADDLIRARWDSALYAWNAAPASRAPSGSEN